MMMIDKLYVQKLRGLDIMSVADALGMGLRHRRALCIHHDDHHPSLAFNVKKNTCHCYSCGFSADTIGLVRERMQMDFPEACKWLADRFGVYIGDTGGRLPGQPASTASSRRLASVREICRHQWAAGQPAEPRPVDVEYYRSLFAQMGLTPAGSRFLFGERMLSRAAVDMCRIVSTEQRLCMGRTGQGAFDAPCLLIPYFNIDGRLVSVQSRYLGAPGEGKGVPRFKFAPGSHRMVYGLERLRGYAADEPLLLTEGPSDCWTALTLGFQAIAVPSATLFDRSWLPLLEGRNLHIFPDQDEAGLSLYFELKKALPQLVYHQLPAGCKDLSELYLRMRREGLPLQEASARVRSEWNSEGVWSSLA